MTTIDLTVVPRYQVEYAGPDVAPDGREWYTAYFTELPACTAMGPTKEAAEQSLWRGLPQFLRMLKEHGQEQPKAISAESIGAAESLPTASSRHDIRVMTSVPNAPAGVTACLAT